MGKDSRTNSSSHYLTHKPDKNAVYKDYYLTDDHEGIVSRETWNAAQARVYREQEERKIGIMRGGDHHFLYGKVFCGECGSPYKRRTVTSSGHHYKVSVKPETYRQYISGSVTL